jgi:hypothetical protein
MKTELLPQLTSNAKSFNHKAMIETNDQSTTLYSYYTKIATYKNGYVTLHTPTLLSATTLRHLKEFLSQCYGKALTLTKKQLTPRVGETFLLTDLVKGV